MPISLSSQRSAVPNPTTPTTPMISSWNILTMQHQIAPNSKVCYAKQQVFWTFAMRQLENAGNQWKRMPHSLLTSRRIPKKNVCFHELRFCQQEAHMISIDTVRHVHLRTLSSTKGTKMNCASIGKYRENAWKCRSELKAFYILLFCSIMFYSIHIDSYSLIAELYPFRMERLIIPSRPWMCRLSESQSGNHPM